MREIVDEWGGSGDACVLVSVVQHSAQMSTCTPPLVQLVFAAFLCLPHSGQVSQWESGGVGVCCASQLVSEWEWGGGGGCCDE